MNNQMPYFMPPFDNGGNNYGCNCNNNNNTCHCKKEIQMINERLTNLERAVKVLERKTSPNNNIKPMPISNLSNDTNYNGNYMI